jgi:hypothetical protein
MKYLAAALLSVVLVACGGGGGGLPSPSSEAALPSPSSEAALPSQSSGVGTGALRGILAADGSAMAYGSIKITSLVDNTSYSGVADINGNVSIPTSGVTFPAIVKASSLSGSKANYGYIGSSTQTSVPVNPFSTLILSIASNGNPAAITSTTQLTSSSITAAKTSVNTIFSKIFQAFSVNTSTDLLSTNFQTNHTGLDLILDAVNVKFDAEGNPTICTKILNFCKTLDLANLDASAILISAAEVSSLNNAPIASCSKFINSLTSSSIATESTLYASDFLNAGLNSKLYRQSLAEKFGVIAATFNNPIFIGTDANSNYVFQFDTFNTTAKQYAGSFSMPLKLDGGGNCVMAGDQLPFFIEVLSQITVQTRVDGTSNAAVTTTSPVRGLRFRANGGASQNTVNVNGSSVLIQTLQFYMCDSGGNCPNNLITLNKSSSNSGYYFLQNNVNTLPLVDYYTAGINTSNAFYNNNTNPILVKMLDSGGVEKNRIYLKIKGGYITSEEMNSISLPSITNAQAILSTSTTLVNPSADINIPTGIIVRDVTLSSGIVSSGAVTSTSKYVLSDTSLSTTVSRTIDSTSTFRDIGIFASTTSGTPISITYVWSPTCPQCR